MNKSLIIGGVVAVVIIGGIVFALNRQGGAPNPEDIRGDQILADSKTTPVVDANARVAFSGGVFTGSLKQLTSRSGNFKCTFSSSVQNSDSSGTIYISNGKMRGDFVSSIKGVGAQTTDSHMIQDGTNMYMWSAESPQGIKMNISAMEGAENETTPMKNQMIDPNQQANYDCTEWKADTGMFAPPKTVTFMDMSQMMPKAGTIPNIDLKNIPNMPNMENMPEMAN